MTTAGCERELSALEKSGSSRLAMRTKEVLLPTRDSPSVITTVAGNPVRGRVSESRAWKRVPTAKGSLDEAESIYQQKSIEGELCLPSVCNKEGGLRFGGSLSYIKDKIGGHYGA